MVQCDEESAIRDQAARVEGHDSPRCVYHGSDHIAQQRGAQAVEELRTAGAEVAIVEPDEASMAAIGTNPLDPSTRKPAAEAGRAQGRGLKIEWNRA
jgi:hypothetical protein